MSFLKQVEEMSLEDGFSGHYHNGYLMAKGEATEIVIEADARITELEAELAHLRAVAEPSSDGSKPRHSPELLEELDKMVRFGKCLPTSTLYFGKIAEEIRYQMGLVNILADTAAYYRGSTVPQVKLMAASLYKVADDNDEPSLHEFMDEFTPDMLPGFWAGGRTPQDIQEEEAKDVRSEHNEE